MGYMMPKQTPVIAIIGTTYSVVRAMAASFARGRLFSVA